MRVIAKRMLREFWEVHQDCEQQLKSWFSEAEKAEWKSPEEIRKDFPSASILKSNRVIFNIKGNSYRLIVQINYGSGIVWVRFIGTHEEYDNVNAETV
jgi:mRNA interferase HigB